VSIKPKLGLFDLTMVTVSLVIGMGIFRTPVEVANKAGTPTVLFAAWIIGAIVSLFGALTFAEIGSRYHVTGGFYRIFSHCYHPAFAFMVNWMTVISNASSTAIVAIIGAEYINPLIMPGVDHDIGVKITTISAIVILYILNMLGIKMSARALNVLMIIKIALMVMLISAIFIPASSPPLAVTSSSSFGNSINAFWLCFVPVFFTYGGYQQTMNFGSDVPDAGRTMPRAIFWGIAIILMLYLLINLSYYHVLGIDGIRTSTALASDMAAVILGSSASKVIAVVMFLSVMAYVNASIMSNPRVYYAMAEDKVLPPVFAKVNGKTQVQEFATTVFVAFMLVTLFLTSSFSKVLNYVMFFDSISLITASAAIFVLRYRARKNGAEPGIYKIPFYPWLPAIFVITYTLVNVSILVSNPAASAIGFILFISGWPLFYILRRILNGRTVIHTK
jgi:APA family basic amino acid/polyamine antiporter